MSYQALKFRRVVKRNSAWAEESPEVKKVRDEAIKTLEREKQTLLRILEQGRQLEEV